MPGLLPGIGDQSLGEKTRENLGELSGRSKSPGCPQPENSLFRGARNSKGPSEIDLQERSGELCETVEPLGLFEETQL